MTKYTRMALIVSGLLLAGCGASGADDEVTSSVTPTEELLTTISYEDLELSFYEMDATGTEGEYGQIAIEEGFRSVDYLGALREQYGSLTALEIFEAFAPDGLEAPAALVAAHEAQALAFGRAGEELEARDIDVSTLSVNKAIQANCQSQVLPNISPGVYGSTVSRDIDADRKYFYTCVGSPQKVGGPQASPNTNIGCARLSNKTELTVGICNDSASTRSTEFWTQINRPLGVMDITQRANVAPGTARRFTILRATGEGPFGFFYGLGVIGLNPGRDFHRQISGQGFFP